MNTCNVENQLLAVEAAGAPILTWFQLPAPQGFECPKFHKEMVTSGGLWFDVTTQVYRITPMDQLQLKAEEEVAPSTKTQANVAIAKTGTERMIPSRATAKAAPAGITVPIGPVPESALAGGTVEQELTPDNSSPWSHKEDDVDWNTEVLPTAGGLPTVQGE